MTFLGIRRVDLLVWRMPLQQKQRLMETEKVDRELLQINPAEKRTNRQKALAKHTESISNPCIINFCLMFLCRKVLAFLLSFYITRENFQCPSSHTSPTAASVCSLSGLLNKLSKKNCTNLLT